MLTSKERIQRIIQHQPVDRIGLFEVFWREAQERWSAEGHFAKPEMAAEHFGLDLRRTGGEVKELVDCLGNHNGGLIGLLPTDIVGLGGKPENVGYMRDAFKTSYKL
jgi:hypothetical protein